MEELSAASLQCHFHCQKYYIIENYNCFLSSLRVDAHCFNFDKFRDTALLKQIKQNKPGGGGGVYLHTTPTSSEW